MVVAAWALLVGASGCGEREETEAIGRNDSVTSTQEPLNGLGMEKLIPLRIVNAMNCNPALPTCNWEQRYEGILRSVDFANGVFAGAGVQFWIRSFEGIHLPDFVDLSKWFGENPPSPLPWPQVRGQLQRVFPQISNREFNSDRTFG